MPSFSTPSSLLQSPNAIPPRTSSAPGNNSAAHLSTPTKPVLRPVPESAWIGQTSHSYTHRARKPSNSAPGASTSFLANMQTPERPDPRRYETEDFNYSKKPWAEDKEKVIVGPFDYLYNQPGKDFRAQLINAFNEWLDVPAESLEIITKVVGMLHTASLLIDDVEDHSILRRGLPVAHSLFGIPQTINSANYIYFCALQELQKLHNPKCITIYAEELLNLHRGQGMDLFWRDTLTCPTEDDYLEMVGHKTGGLFRLGIKLMQAESRSLVDCVSLVNLVGLIFQIRDDYQNLHSTEYSENKGMAEDLTEGKFSFPVIHSIRYDPTNLQLINILKQKTADEEVKRYAIKYMEKTESFSYTRKVLDVLIERARKVTDELDDKGGKNKGIHLILDRMVIGGAQEMHAPAASK